MQSTTITRREMIREISPFSKVSTAHGLALFLLDYIVYIAAIAGALLLPSLWMQLLASMVAGFKIGTLLTVGHDAAHGSLVKGKRLNWFLGVMSFLPCLYSYRMWVYDHHILHHAHTNKDHRDTYTPLTKAEFDALPRWRQWVERFYRQANPISFATYYIVERWSQAKLFPHAGLPASMRTSAWKHFAFVVSVNLVYAAFLLAAPLYSHNSPLMGLFLGLLLPFFTFMFAACLVLWSMHTNPDLAWYRGDAPNAELERAGELVSVHVDLPRWLGWMVHDVNNHPVHHLYPAMPCYRLHKAQIRYNQLMGERTVVAKASIGYIFDTMRRCKLYDFERNHWLDFDGKPTTGLTKPYRNFPTASVEVGSS